ncbi:2304_t:CDS:1, partial [Gigaspora margarita]
VIIAGGKISPLELLLLVVKLHCWCRSCDFAIGELSLLVSVLQK